MADTFANQKTVCIHKDKCDKNFLQIQNEHWRYAGRELKYGTFKLYLELAGNNNGFKYRLSKSGSETNLGISKNVYYRAVEELIEKGYLVEANGNTYDFYTVPYKGQNQDDTCPVEGTPTSPLQGTLDENSPVEGTANSKSSPLQGTPNCPLEGNLNSPVEGNSPLQGTPCPVEGTVESRRRDNLSRVRVENIDSIDNLYSNLDRDGYPLGSLDGNFVSLERHPSGSSEHPSDAASLKAKPEQTEQKQSNRKGKYRVPEELTIDEKIRLCEMYQTVSYKDIYEDPDLRIRRGSVTREKMEEIKAEVEEYNRDESRRSIVSYLNDNAYMLDKLSDSLGCSREDVRDNVSSLGMSPDGLMACVANDTSGVYSMEYWEKNEKSRGQYSEYWDWVHDMYKINVDSALKSVSASALEQFESNEDKDDDMDLSWLE